MKLGQKPITYFYCIFSSVISTLNLFFVTRFSTPYSHVIFSELWLSFGRQAIVKIRD